MSQCLLILYFGLLEFRIFWCSIGVMFCVVDPILSGWLCLKVLKYYSLRHIFICPLKITPFPQVFVIRPNSKIGGVERQTKHTATADRAHLLWRPCHVQRSIIRSVHRLNKKITTEKPLHRHSHTACYYLLFTISHDAYMN